VLRCVVLNFVVYSHFFPCFFLFQQDVGGIVIVFVVADDVDAIQVCADMFVLAPLFGKFHDFSLFCQ